MTQERNSFTLIEFDTQRVALAIKVTHLCQSVTNKCGPTQSLVQNAHMDENDCCGKQLVVIVTIK